MSIFGNASGQSIFGNSNPAAAATTPLFGSTPNPNPNPLQAQPTQLFGNTNTNTNSNPNPNTNTGGGLFGSTNTNQTTGGLFGNTTTTTNQPPPTGGGIFGNQAQPAAGTSLFGNAATPSNTTGTNSLFGNTATNNANAGTTGSSLFGNTTNNATATGGGLFGNAAQQQVQSGLNNPLFGGQGNSTATTNPGGIVTGGGLFGSTNTSTGGGLFGSTNTNTGGGGLFGSSPNTQQPANTAGAAPAGAGLFGNTQAGSSLFGGAKPATGGGLFGSGTASNTATNTNTNSLFGGSLFGGQTQQQQQQPQQQPSLFGSTTGNQLFGGNKSTLGTSALGAPAQQNPGFGSSALTTANNLLSTRSTVGSQQHPADAHVQFAKLTQTIEGIYNAWNPASRECRFQYNFYNLVDPKQVNLYGRPPNATNDAMWEKAVRENPEPSCMVPVIAIGFDDLRQRADAQSAQSTFHIQKISDLQSRLSALRTQHSVSNASRLLRAASVQTQQTQRLMRLIQHLHLLIPAVRSSALRPEEEALRGKLEELEEEMRRGRVKSRLNELWALIGAVGAGIERSGGGGGAGGEWAVVDEEGLAQIAQILGEQQAGLQHLTKILQKDQKDLNVILGNKPARDAEDIGYSQDGGDVLWGSTSTFGGGSMG